LERPRPPGRKTLPAAVPAARGRGWWPGGGAAFSWSRNRPACPTAPSAPGAASPRAQFQGGWHARRPVGNAEGRPGPRRALVALGTHLAWERLRYRLDTPKGTIRVGMTWVEVEAVLGPPSMSVKTVFSSYSRHEWQLEGTVSRFISAIRRSRSPRSYWPPS